MESSAGPAGGAGGGAGGEHAVTNARMKRDASFRIRQVFHASSNRFKARYALRSRCVFLNSSSSRATLLITPGNDGSQPSARAFGLRTF